MLVDGGGNAETQADNLECENQRQTRGAQRRSISDRGSGNAVLHGVDDLAAWGRIRE